jgi:hypothetical protein
MHTGAGRAGPRRPEAGSPPGKPGALPPWFHLGEERVKGVEGVKDVEGVELLRHQSKVILCRRERAVSRRQKGAANGLKSLKGLKSLNFWDAREGRYFSAGDQGKGVLAN